MVLKIQCVVPCQWLKLHQVNFHTIYMYTNSLLQDHPLYKNQFLAILDSFF